MIARGDGSPVQVSHDSAVNAKSMHSLELGLGDEVATTARIVGADQHVGMRITATVGQATRTKPRRALVTRERGTTIKINKGLRAASAAQRHDVLLYIARVLKVARCQASTKLGARNTIVALRCTIELVTATPAEALLTGLAVRAKDDIRAAN